MAAKSGAGAIFKYFAAAAIIPFDVYKNPFIVRMQIHARGKRRHCAAALPNLRSLTIGSRNFRRAFPDIPRVDSCLRVNSGPISQKPPLDRVPHVCFFGAALNGKRLADSRFSKRQDFVVGSRYIPSERKAEIFLPRQLRIDFYFKSLIAKASRVLELRSEPRGYCNGNVLQQIPRFPIEIGEPRGNALVK